MKGALCQEPRRKRVFVVEFLDIDEPIAWIRDLRSEM